MTNYCGEKKLPKMIVTFAEDGDKVEFEHGEQITPVRIQRSFLTARRQLKAVQAQFRQEQQEKERREAELKADLKKRSEEDRAKEEKKRCSQ